MIVRCTDKYRNKTLEILKWAFVFTGMGDTLGKFLVFAEHESTYQVGHTYEFEFKEYEIS